MAVSSAFFPASLSSLPSGCENPSWTDIAVDGLMQQQIFSWWKKRRTEFGGGSQRLWECQKWWYLYSWYAACQSEEQLSFHMGSLIDHLQKENSRLGRQILHETPSSVFGQLSLFSYPTCSWHVYAQSVNANSSISLSTIIIRNTYYCWEKSIIQSPNKYKWPFLLCFRLFTPPRPFGSLDNQVG